MIRPYKLARVQANLILNRFRKTAAMPTYHSRVRSLVTPRSRAGRLRLSVSEAVSGSWASSELWA